MAYSELIKDFSKIRDYLRQFYVYGFKTRLEYTGKSARTYDNERKRIESWLGEYMQATQTAAGKSVFLSVDSRAIVQNPLYRAFKAKSFTANDILLHFYLLDILVSGVRLTVTEIQDALAERYLYQLDLKREPSLDIIRKKLNEYVELGLLVVQKEGNKLYYLRAESQVELASWREALNFFSEVLPLGVVGATLLDKLPAGESPFIYKHNYILHALDSELFYKLLLALNEKSKVKLLGYSSKSGQGFECVVLPLEFYISTQTGREYLLCWHYEWQRLFALRLDYLQEAEVTEVEADFQYYAQALQEAKQHLWGVSFGNGKDLEHVELVLYIGKDEAYIVQRLLREARCGVVEQLDARHYRYMGDVYDAWEMLPWVRTFIGRIASFTCSNKELETRFWEDLRALNALYDVALGGEADAF